MLIVSLIFLQVIIFTGMIFLLKNIMSKNVGAATKHLEEMGQEYAKKEKEIEKQLEEIKQKSQEILTKAEADGLKQKEQIVRSAQEEKDKVINTAQAKADEIMRQADRAYKALLDQINKKIEEGARDEAVRLLGKALPEELRRDVHNHWVGNLIAGNLQQLDRLRVDGVVAQAGVISAFSLTEEQRRGLSEKIKEKLGRDLEIKEEINPQIIAGLVVNIGSIVFDGSLKSKIQQAAYSI